MTAPTAKPKPPPAPEQPPAQGAAPLASPRDEYLDASANARQFNVLRFAELTIFVTATGALLAATFSRAAAPTSPEVALAFKLAGLLVTGVFWALQRRTMIYWRHFVRRAAELEPALGFRQYSSRPGEGWLPGSRAVNLLFIFVAAFWLAAIALGPGLAA